MAANLLANQLGISGLENKINAFNDEVKSSGKAVGNVKFEIEIKNPMKVLSAYGSVVNNVIDLSQSNSQENVHETVNSLLQAIYQTN